MAIKSYSLRIDADLLVQLHIVAAYKEHSASSQMLMFICDYVAQFAAQHGRSPSLPTGPVERCYHQRR